MTNKIHSILFIIIIGLLYFVINSSNMGVSRLIEACTAALLLVAVGLFGAFFWQEKSKDEREELLKYQVGRLAFWVGSAVIAIGIVVQKFTAAVDPWLAIALAAMLFTKLGGSYYLHRER